MSHLLCRSLLLLCSTTAVLSASPYSVPISWETIPRYTFCVNSSSPTNITDGVFSDEAAEYIAKQAIYLNNPTITRPPGACIEAETVMPLQAARLPATRRLWVDCLVVNQHVNNHAGFEWWSSTFKASVKSIGSTLLVLLEL